MKDNKLTSKEKQRIEELAKQIRTANHMEFDKNREREDFFGLFNDITQELKKKNNEGVNHFYELVELMRESESILCPDDAYAYGKEAKRNDMEYTEGLRNYFLKVNEAANEKGLTSAKNTLFQELCNTLEDTRKLMTEFIEGYSKILFVENYHIDEFYKLGYERTRTIW